MEAYPPLARKKSDLLIIFLDFLQISHLNRIRLSAQNTFKAENVSYITNNIFKM